MHRRQRQRLYRGHLATSKRLAGDKIACQTARSAARLIGIARRERLSPSLGGLGSICTGGGGQRREDCLAQ
jgi:hypothetical protein